MAKDRGLKTREPFSTTIDKNLKVAFMELVEERDSSQSKLLDRAIELLLKHFDKEIPPRSGK